VVIGLRSDCSTPGAVISARWLLHRLSSYARRASAQLVPHANDWTARYGAARKRSDDRLIILRRTSGAIRSTTPNPDGEHAAV